MLCVTDLKYLDYKWTWEIVCKDSHQFFPFLCIILLFPSVWDWFVICFDQQDVTVMGCCVSSRPEETCQFLVHLLLRLGHVKKCRLAYQMTKGHTETDQPTRSRGFSHQLRHQAREWHDLGCSISGNPSWIQPHVWAQQTQFGSSHLPAEPSQPSEL